MNNVLSDWLLVIGGPTASGKSALALALAEKLALEGMGGAIINADSMQIYRGLPILTAQPCAADLARAPHLLYGALDIAETCSAGRWLEMATAAIAEARAQGRLPIVVGGTGLYLRSLTGGLAPIPPIPEAVRAATRARLAEIGPAAFHGELAARDPEMAARLRPSDSQRLSRAAEVLAATGRSLADWQRDAAPPPVEGRIRTILLSPPRGELYAACDARFAAMLAQGALEEAAGVAARIEAEALVDSLPALKTLGLRELIAFSKGSLDLAGATAAAQQATRNYAKRQTTWFRGQFLAGYTVDEKLNERSVTDSAKKIIDWLLTP
ncbi:MAG TPA: tRNA (adenosine(37)-N6)-dimethylallyltransferase MiaA [Alphaproteobacteria bacterium]|nr:tRNA (adenosine(37)-N6)-dimethylallyltransferase MiaA [Alphaproteobacteria bacterium]